ncbi:glyceraldehyde-3-phosphate ferredoxin oxidoreductase [Desulfurococcaceae archaeon MEX13E-LK6-19]|nr:glyceraldehyde-3-phosphate ferredoxin oxidoreductase [Desulfurococcaceae archaeon MEX13E-LK6-19]
MPAVYRVLFIDVGKRDYWVEEYPIEEVGGPIELGVKLHLEKYETYKKPVYSPDNVVVIGRGVFAGTKLYGVHRFTVVFRSPLTRGLHVASMGGAAYQFNVNADAMVIVGYSETPLILKVYDEGNGEPKVEFHEVDEGLLENIWSGFGDEKGVYALQKWLSERFLDFYKEYNGRSILTGPAAKYTSLGALVSITLNKGVMDRGSEEYAARGGPGSVLYRAHHVAAIVYGGKYNVGEKRPQDLLDTRKINDIFRKLAGETYPFVVIKAGTKYRYDEKLKTGGTFGGNYPHLKTLTPMFNWNMIYMPIELRQKFHEIIMKYMWEPFNKQAIETREWKTCGEPCPIACKKVRKGKYKTDYEPYEGQGPIIGVFDINEIEKGVEAIDSLGFDAIEVSNVVAWIFDALEKGLLRPDEVGLRDKPCFNPETYTLECSKKNIELAVKILHDLAWGRQPLLRLIGEKGLRSAAKILDILYEDRVKTVGLKFEDLAVYALFGEEGHITPNFYWTPGMVAPLAVLGRYWTLYKSVFVEPEEYAAKAVDRAIKELFIDNMGLCRFHRGWAEKYLPELAKTYYGVDPVAKAKEVYKKIIEYQDKAAANPVFWDSKKIIDYMALGAKEFGNEEWAKKFEEDKVKAAREWWDRFYKKMYEILGLK